jgi:hypothetical protein
LTSFYHAQPCACCSMFGRRLASKCEHFRVYCFFLHNFTTSYATCLLSRLAHMCPPSFGSCKCVANISWKFKPVSLLMNSSLESTGYQVVWVDFLCNFRALSAETFLLE